MSAAIVESADRLVSSLVPSLPPNDPRAHRLLQRNRPLLHLGVVRSGDVVRALREADADRLELRPAADAKRVGDNRLIARNHQLDEDHDVALHRALRHRADRAS